MAAPDGIKTVNDMVAWHDAHDRVWSENPPAGNPAFAQNWMQRCREIIDKYDLDLLYFDDTGLPLGQAGLDIAQYYYRGSIGTHGKLEGVVTGKLLTPTQRLSILEDVERGAANDIHPTAWQTDTCIGDWHYDRRIFTRHGYKSVKTVVQNLCDCISKNGNLLLSIPIRGNGEIDADERQFLEDLAAWMAPRGEGIFASRPWTRFGEGPVNNGGGMMTERSNAAYTPQDMRFTVNKGALYAWLLHPAEDGKVTIRSLAGKGRVERVELLGHAGAVPFTHTVQGLSLVLPPEAGRVVPGLKICGRGIV
jgi:alpha-L-fucosidase